MSQEVKIKRKLQEQVRQETAKQQGILLDKEAKAVTDDDEKAKRELIDRYRGKLQVSTEENIYGVRIPASMDMLSASIELLDMYKQNESKQSFSFDFNDRYYADTLYACYQVFNEELGRINPIPSAHRFSNEIVGYDDEGGARRVELFMGYMEIPAFEDGYVGILPTSTMSVVIYAPEIKRKYIEALNDLVAKVSRRLKESSLYSGSSVKLTMEQYDDKSFWKFVAFKNVVNPHIILNKEEESVIDDFIIPDLQDTGKRTYLLFGGFGNGKTETALRIGKAATDQGYLFVYVKNSKDFMNILSVSRSYSKLCIFMEDLDEIGEGEERTAIINELLNTLDGVDSKNSNVKVIFTTNNAHKLNPGLRRPGRLDLIIPFDQPTVATAERIFKLMLADCIDKDSDVDIKTAVKHLNSFEGTMSGAVVAEVCKRAKRLWKLNQKLTQKSLIAAVNSIKAQMKMMDEEVKELEFVKVKKSLALLGDYLMEDSE